MKRQIYKLKDTAQTNYTTLDPQNLHLFVDESEESGGGDFIPLAGTEVGNPVTGLIHTQGDVRILQSVVSGADELNSAININIGQVSMVADYYEDASGDYFAGIISIDPQISPDFPIILDTLNTATLIRANIISRGLVGTFYYGANYDDNTYVQKKYVDDNFEPIGGGGGVVPDASPTVKGISKLYNDLLASNTDGGVTQSALVAKFRLVDNQLNNFLRDKTGIKRAFEIVPNATYEPSAWGTSDFNTQGNYSKSGEAGVGFKTTATAGNIAFKRRAATLNMKGNTGIFWEKIKFDSAVTDARFVHCLTPDFFFSAPTNVSPTSLLNVVGICKLSTSQNLHVFHNDASGVATTIDLGASFPANNIGGDKLYLIGLEAKNSSFVVHVHQLDLSTWELNGTSVVTEVSTDIPNRLTSDLRLTTFITNNTTASIASYVDYHVLATNIK